MLLSKHIFQILVTTILNQLDAVGHDENVLSTIAFDGNFFNDGGRAITKAQRTFVDDHMTLDYCRICMRQHIPMFLTGSFERTRNGAWYARTSTGTRKCLVLFVRPSNLWRNPQPTQNKRRIHENQEADESNIPNEVSWMTDDRSWHKKLCSQKVSGAG